ncbi:Sporulation integral membrane protein YtvI [Syntrophomonas zehnderi OL-4]|uniref:Sporulation integral membrane protein YtvI n=1 Tax=Syntrophomonas zehnderi OL-4 TaxID=690567 RepID=A0A0E4GDX5_9FIRM|nr:sporulation integral membrane protein YtvI [Syntrophomonas zehnderi]CFX66970.1 Sporulation integral membrane protein YtvI [Syntrophomonas zehnderi OL-4]
MDADIKRGLNILIKLSIFVMALVAFYLLFTYVLPVIGRFLAYIPVLFMPFILALLLALIVEPVVGFFEKKLRLKRVPAVVVSLLLVIGGFIYIVSSLIIVIIRQMTSLYYMAIKHSDQIVGMLMSTLTNMRLYYVRLDLPPQVQETLHTNLQKALGSVQSLMDTSIKGLIEALSALPGLMIFLMIATVATFFIIKDRALLRSFVLHILPADAQSTGRNVIGELFNAFVGFVKAYGILIFITFVATLVALKILQIKYALTIALIIGLLDILPVLGPGTFYLPWILWEFIAGRTGLAIALLVVYITISAIRQFLEPKIVGDNIGLHPLATLVSLYVGLKLGGIVGMILGPVCVVILIAMYRAGLFARFDWRKKKIE